MNNIKKKHFYYLLVPVVFVFIYIVYRAQFSSFTHDESLTFKILLGNTHLRNFSTNNHYFNTLLMQISSKLFGFGEFALRLPNVLAFILYAFFSIKIILKNAVSWQILFIGFLLFFSHLAILEFFSLARGYGLSFAFMIASLYYLFNYTEFESYSKFNKNLIFSIVFGLLMVYSSFNTIYLYIAILAVFFLDYAIILIKSGIKLNYNKLLLSFSIWLSGFGLLYFAINKLWWYKKKGQLWFGGHSGLVKDVFQSVTDNWLYISRNFEQNHKMATTVFLIFFIAAFFFILIYKLVFTNYSKLSKVFILFFIIIFGSIAQNLLFNTPFPYARTGLFYVVLFSLLVFFFYVELFTNIKNQTLKTILAICISIPLIYNVKSINTKYTYEWYYDAHNRNVMQIIKQKTNNISHKGNKITVANNWVFEPSLNYYRHLLNLTYINEINRKGLSRKADFYYCFENEINKLNDSLIVIAKYPDIKTVLFQRKTNHE